MWGNLNATVEVAHAPLPPTGRAAKSGAQSFAQFAKGWGIERSSTVLLTASNHQPLYCPKIATPPTAMLCAMRSFHSSGPVMCTLVPLASTATVTGISTTSNS